MPKPKPKNSSAPADAKSTYDPDDVAEFVSALEGDEVTAEQPSGRKVPVITERPKKRVKKEPVVPAGPTPAEQLDSVWHDAVPTSAATESLQIFDRTRRSSWPWGWILLGLLIVGGVTIGGFFYFNRAKQFTGDNVQVQLTAPTEISSGADVAITFKYQNQETVDLTNAEANVEYPEGFTFVSSTVKPNNEFNNAFSIGTIKSGNAGSITITGHVIGSVGTDRLFKGTVSYRPANFNSDFQEHASATVKITSSILDVGFEGPTSVAPGGSATWTLTYANTSDHDLSNVQVAAEFPQGFTVTKTDPVPLSDTTWQLNKVKKGATGKIAVTGTIAGAAGDTVQLVARAGIRSSGTSIDLQDEQTLLVILINTGLTTTIAVNGETEANAINPGESLNYAVHVANKSEAEIADVSIVLALTGTVLKMTDTQNPQKATVKKTTITWTKKEVPGLALLKPGQDIIVNFTVATTQPGTIKTDADTNIHVSAQATVTAPSLVDGALTPTMVVTKVNGQLSFSADARYYNDQGAALGSGPVPPKVGQTTTYRIIWTVTTTTSDATTFVASATLPATAFWTGKNVSRDAGDLDFDPATRSVRWTVNKIPAGTGSRSNALTASFDVAVTPTADQVGTMVVLTDTTKVTAADAYTVTALSASAPSLTSDVPNDPQAGGEGKVVN